MFLNISTLGKCFIKISHSVLFEVNKNPEWVSGGSFHRTASWGMCGRLFQVIDNDFKIMNFILALIVGSPWHTATFQTNLTDSGDFITLRLLPSPLILNSFFTEGPQKLQNRLHKLTSYEHSHKKRNWIRIKDKAMYVCTRFQSIWRTSVFVTKCAQKNTLGLSIWIEY